MFLVERLFGISIYMLVLIFVCFLLVKTNTSCRAALRFYLVCLCCMAFFYKPYITADLYRIFEQMNFFSTMEFDFFWKNFALESSIPLARLIFWFFGKIGYNELLPVFSTLFCYSLIFYVVNKTKQQFDISKQTVATELFFIMSTSMYISVIGGIRMMMALSMLTFSYFRMTIEKKIKIIDVLFFIASVFIHAMSFVVIGIVALTLLFESDRNVFKKIGYALGIGVAGCAFIVRFSDTVQGLFNKFLEYVLGDKHSDPWEYLMGVSIVIILILGFSEFRIIRKSGNCAEVNKYNLAAIFCVVLAICFNFEFSIFYRFGGHLAVMFSIPTMMISMDRTSEKASIFFKMSNFRTMVILLSCIVVAISCTRGSLSSLKFFEL